MSRSPAVRVAVSSRAENVAVIREVLAGLDDVARFGSALDDVKTAVSEACNNVVMHAYDGSEGLLEVDLRVLENELEAVVRDEGVGIGFGEFAQAPGAGEITDLRSDRGLGLAVIGALAQAVEVRRREPSGVEVLMRFVLPEGGIPAGDGPEPDPLDAPAWSAGTVQLVLTPASLATAVLARALCAVAARAGFSIDRLSDSQLVADALTAHLPPELTVDCLAVSLHSSRRRVGLELGPLRSGGARRVLAASAIGELGGVIERLSDEVDFREEDAVEYLSLVMVDQARG